MSELSQKLIDILSEQVDEKKLQESMQEGMEKGITQGEDRKARSTARAMLARNLDIALIADCTGLPQSEVEAMAAGELVKG